MFKKLRNIDTAFQFARLIAIVSIVASLLLTGFCWFSFQSAMERQQQKLYVLAEGKVFEAFAADRNENVEVEAIDHVATFHKLFFTLEPDEAFIEGNMKRAVYCGDESIQRQYDNLREENYFSNIIAGNVSQHVVAGTDTVTLNYGNNRLSFRYVSTLKLTRTSVIQYRQLITTGFLRSMQRSSHNPHGFSIEQWRIVNNSTIKTETR